MKEHSKEDFFILFSNCIPVKGFKRSIIVDLQNQNYEIIPNGLFDILHIYKNYRFSQILSKYNKSDRTVIKEYFDFLVQKKWGFWSNLAEEKKLFPRLSNEHFFPYEISNLILDINDHKYDILTLLKDVVSLNIPFIQIRVFNKGDVKILIAFFKKISTTGVIGIELVIPYGSFKEEDINFLTENFTFIYEVNVHGSPQNITLQMNEANINFTTEKLYSCKNCGVINPKYFTANILSYTESLSFNTCLNRKIAVDENGFIKKCPSMEKALGHISKNTLSEVVNLADFKLFDKIKKDDILICKDCEFRHICTDCRAYIFNPDDLYSKPLKCGYDPYRGKWEKWASLKGNKDAIAYYQLGEIGDQV